MTRAIAERCAETQISAIAVDARKVSGDYAATPGFCALDGGKDPARKFAGGTVLTVRRVGDVAACPTTLGR